MLMVTSLQDNQIPIKLCEGQIDELTVVDMGYDHIKWGVAAFGAISSDAITTEQIIG